jgi:hypothetical protein
MVNILCLYVVALWVVFSKFKLVRWSWVVRNGLGVRWFPAVISIPDEMSRESLRRLAFLRASSPSKHLEIFALFPVRYFGLEALDFGVLDVDVVVDEAGAERIAEERIILQREHRLTQCLRQ